MESWRAVWPRVVHRVPGSNSFACSVASANRKEADNNNNNNNKNETQVGTYLGRTEAMNMILLSIDHCRVRNLPLLLLRTYVPDGKPEP